MASTVDAIPFDCADPRLPVGFRVEVLDYGVTELGDESGRIAHPEGTGPTLLFLKVPEPGVVKNRVHIDRRADDVEAEVGRLEAPGARRLRLVREGGGSCWVMADPEGNEFCVGGP